MISVDLNLKCRTAFMKSHREKESNFTLKPTSHCKSKVILSFLSIQKPKKKCFLKELERTSLDEEKT